MENKKVKLFEDFVNEWKISFKKSNLEKEVINIMEDIENIKNLRKVENIIFFRYKNEPYTMTVKDEKEEKFLNSYHVNATEIDSILGKKFYKTLKQINNDI